MILNPFFIYSLAMTLALSIYSLHWSKLTPSLTFEVASFIIISILISVIMALLTRNTTEVNTEEEYKFIDLFKRKNKIIFWILFYCLSIQFVYAGSIPLIDQIRGIEIDYTGFGIPVVSLLVVTISNVISAIFFDFYLLTKKRKYLTYSVILAMFSLLMFNRGNLLIYLIQCFIIFFIRRGINFKKILKVFILGLVILFLFGWLGNLREVNSDVSVKDLTSNYILTIGEANDEFKSSDIPKEFFWAYIYISTPLANLQNNVNKLPFHKGYYVDNIPLFVVNELLPDFISKRVNDYYLVERAENLKVSKAFTVGGLYGKSYVYLGWLGVIITYFYFILIIFSFLKLSQNKSLTVAPIAIIGTFAFFTLFTNVIAYSAISLQLIWVLMAHKYYKY